MKLVTPRGPYHKIIDYMPKDKIPQDQVIGDLIESKHMNNQVQLDQ